MSNAIVTVFGSSRPREGEHDYQEARELGALLAQHGYTICNGGYGGTMEASARGAKDAGGKTVGVIAKFFSTDSNKYIDKKIIKDTHVERLLELIRIGDAFVVLRGGTGTLLELAMAWEYMNKNVIGIKPLVVVGKFWSPVVQTLKEELAYEGKGDATKYVTAVSSPQECLNVLQELLK